MTDEQAARDQTDEALRAACYMFTNENFHLFAQYLELNSEEQEYAAAVIQNAAEISAIRVIRHAGIE